MPGRTSDAQLYVAAPSGVVQVKQALGVTLGGDLQATQESTLGNPWAAAVGHAIGGGARFSTVFDAPDTAALLNLDEGAGHLLATTVNPTTWQWLPIGWSRGGFDLPEGGAITRPWALMRSGFGGTGRRVSTVQVRGGTTTTLISSAQTSNGKLIGVLIPTVGSGVTRMTLTPGGNIGNKPGFFRGMLATSGNVTLKVDGGNAQFSVIVVQGDAETAPPARPAGDPPSSSNIAIPATGPLSGANTILKVGNTTFGPGDGITGLRVGVESGAFGFTSRGVTTEFPSGDHAATITFNAYETAATVAALLGKHGQWTKCSIQRTSGSYIVGSSGGDRNVLAQVGREFADRGARMFNVTLYLDGAP